VLALTGDSMGAMQAVDAAMPGTSARVMPLLQRLPALAPAQKAAAVNLGIFPDNGTAAYAYAAPATSSGSSPSFAGTVTTERLAGIDDLLRQPSPPAAQPVYKPAPVPTAAAPTAQPIAQPMRVAYSAPVNQPPRTQASPQFTQRKIWLQLASGSNAAALPSQFERIRSRDRELFDGIPGYVAEGPDRARLIVGPFASATDADTFAADLEAVNVNAFKWSNSESDRIVPLGTP
jgi:hypothetical protein